MSSKVVHVNAGNLAEKQGQTVSCMGVAVESSVMGQFTMSAADGKPITVTYPPQIQPPPPGLAIEVVGMSHNGQLHANQILALPQNGVWNADAWNQVVKYSAVLQHLY